MSSQLTKAALREENLGLAVLLKRATGESLNREEQEFYKELVKRRALEQRLRDKYDLSGAIAKAFRNPASTASTDVGADPKADTLEGAIAKAFQGTPQAPTVAVGNPRELMQSAMDGLQAALDAHDAEETAKARDTRSKIRRDIESGSGLGGSR